MLKFHNITKDDMCNGTGLRVVLWLSGCDRRCEGCQNPQTWDPEVGLDFDAVALEELEVELRKDYIQGVTLTGGDPLYKGNEEDVVDLCKYIKGKYPKKNIWLYTGALWEAIKDHEILHYIDVLCEGPYMIDYHADPHFHWVGSYNQRVIDVKESLKTGELVPLEKDQYERGREIYENQRKNTEKLRTNSQSGDLYVTTPARSEACEDRLRDTCDCFDSDRSC